MARHIPSKISIGQRKTDARAGCGLGAMSCNDMRSFFVEVSIMVRSALSGGLSWTSGLSSDADYDYGHCDCASSTIPVARMHELAS